MELPASRDGDIAAARGFNGVRFQRDAAAIISAFRIRDVGKKGRRRVSLYRHDTRGLTPRRAIALEKKLVSMQFRAL